MDKLTMSNPFVTVFINLC